MKSPRKNLVLPPSPINLGTPISIITKRTLERLTNIDDKIVDLGNYFFNKS